MQPAGAAFDYRQQIGDMFALANAHRFTGPMTIHWKDGQAQKVEWRWDLALGEQAQRFIRLMRGRPPPGTP